MPVHPYLEHQPSLGEGVVLHETAAIAGRVTVAGPAYFDRSAVARGDQSPISIAPRFYLGPGSTIHVEITHPTVIGSDVWVGTDAVVHATTLGNCVRVEDGGLVLSRSRVGSGSIVAADSLVPEGVEFPENSYVEGTPGRRTRDTTPEEREETRRRVAAALAAATAV